MEAELVIGLCQKFHKLPSEVLAESTDLLRYLAILDAAYPEEEGQ